MEEKSNRLYAFFSRLRISGVVLLLMLTVVLVASLMMGGGEVLDVSREGERVAADCALVQTMRFERCKHQVTRRIKATQACVGLDRQGMERQFSDWQLSSFSETEVSMERDIALFCPLHYVLMANESGGLSMYQNRYGDAMAWLLDVEGQMADYSPQTQEKLLLGIGFDTKEALLAALDEGID